MGESGCESNTPPTWQTCRLPVSAEVRDKGFSVCATQQEGATLVFLGTLPLSRFAAGLSGSFRSFNRNISSFVG